MSVREATAGRCVIAVLEGLEKAHSLSHMLDDLCEALENRGSLYSLSLSHGEALGPKIVTVAIFLFLLDIDHMRVSFFYVQQFHVLLY